MMDSLELAGTEGCCRLPCCTGPGAALPNIRAGEAPAAEDDVLVLANGSED